MQEKGLHRSEQVVLALLLLYRMVSTRVLCLVSFNIQEEEV